MRKQSWQMRLIPLFYSTGIIKGLSNNNYAHKVDTLLSCSRWEWQPGVRDRKMGKAAWGCKCGYHRVGICVQKGDVKLAGNPIIKTSHNPTVTYQHRTHARKFKGRKKKRYLQCQQQLKLMGFPSTHPLHPHPSNGIWKFGMSRGQPGKSLLASAGCGYKGWFLPVELIADQHTFAAHSLTSHIQRR